MRIAVQISPSDYRRLSDEELVRRYSELHEPEPLYHLFDRYCHIAYGICLKHNNQDVPGAKRKTEDIFRQMSEVLLSGKVTRFKPWFYNYIHEYLDKNGKKNSTGKIKIEFSDEVNFTTAFTHMPSVFEEAISSAIVNLSQQERKCLELFYASNKNYDEIASETGYPVSQVRKYLHSGHETLKSDLKTLFYRNL